MQDSRIAVENAGEFDARGIILVLWRYKVLILTVFLITVAIGAIISFLVLPKNYEVKATVSLGKTYVSSAPISPIVAPEAAREMIASKDLTAAAAADLNMDPASDMVASFNQGIKVAPIMNTNLVQITVDTGHPSEAAQLLERVIERFKTEGNKTYEQDKALEKSELQTIDKNLSDVEQGIKSVNDAIIGLNHTTEADLQLAFLLDALSRLQERQQDLLDKQYASIKRIDDMEGIGIVAKPAAPTSPVRPHKVTNIILAGLLGLLIGVFAAFTRDYFRANPLNIR